MATVWCQLHVTFRYQTACHSVSYTHLDVYKRQLEDDLMRLFGSERLMGVFNALGVPEGEQLQHKMLTSRCV